MGLVAIAAGADLDQARAAPTAYFVSAQGSDRAPGSAARPWRTIAYATINAPAGAVITVGAGTYQPFTITKTGQTVQGTPGQQVRVVGRAGVRDVIRISAYGASVRSLSVSGCVPDPRPSGSFEDAGSSAVRIDDQAHDVTVSDLTIRGTTDYNDEGLPFGCYGILVHDADGSRIRDNDIAGTGAGVYVNGGGRYAVVEGNRLHDNDVLIRNTWGGNDDFGAIGLGFSNLTSSPGPRAAANAITGNAGPSADYGVDGSGVEIYNASNLRIEGNTIADNDNAVETGTDSDGGCRDNVFVDNEVSGRSAGSTTSRAAGLLLRCATRMRIERNTFFPLDGWVFSLTSDDPFSSDLAGLVISDNRITQHDRVYWDTLASSPPGIVVDYNGFRTDTPPFATYADGSTSEDLAAWVARSGLDQHSWTF